MDIGVHMLDMALHLLGEPQVTDGHRGDVRGVRPARPRRSAAATMRKTGVTEGGVRRRGPVDRVPPAGRRRHAAAGVELGPVDPAGPVLRHGLRVRRRRQHRVGRPGRPGPHAGDLDRAGRGCRPALHPVVPPDGEHREPACCDFLDMVRSGDYASHRGRQALARAAVVDACYASAEQGREVALLTSTTSSTFVTIFSSVTLARRA